MPEFHCELTCGVWTDRITDHLKVKAKGPIYIYILQKRHTFRNAA